MVLTSGEFVTKLLASWRAHPVARDSSHSVGHGVGSFLNVHEGPVYIGSPSARTEAGMREGLVISNGKRVVAYPHEKADIDPPPPLL